MGNSHAGAKTLRRGRLLKRIILIGTCSIFATCLVSIYPAIKASNLDPVKALNNRISMLQWHIAAAQNSFLCRPKQSNPK